LKANSHADPHSHGCPSAPAMPHPGKADVTVALHLSHELLSSQQKSSSPADIARIAASA
jgi:hypothetical protein